MRTLRFTTQPNAKVSLENTSEWGAYEVGMDFITNMVDLEIYEGKMSIGVSSWQTETNKWKMV